MNNKDIKILDENISLQEALQLIIGYCLRYQDGADIEKMMTGIFKVAEKALEVHINQPKILTRQYKDASINWEELRERFFERCTGKNYLAPTTVEGIFEWLKSQLSSQATEVIEQEVYVAVSINDELPPPNKDVFAYHSSDGWQSQCYMNNKKEWYNSWDNDTPATQCYPTHWYKKVKAIIIKSDLDTSNSIS